MDNVESTLFVVYVEDTGWLKYTLKLVREVLSPMNGSAVNALLKVVG